jgi:hypothetical protein
VFSVFAIEDDGADALDFDDRAIAEFDGAGDRSVNFSEGVAMVRHVICGAGVEVPALDSLVVAASSQGRALPSARQCEEGHALEV